MQINSSLQQSISAKIIRADGRVEELGTVYGGTLIQRIISPFRINFVNLKHFIRQLFN